MDPRFNDFLQEKRGDEGSRVQLSRTSLFALSKTDCHDYRTLPGTSKDEMNQAMTMIRFNSDCLKVLGKQKSEVGFLTIGIPSVKRDNGLNYILNTLESILNHTSEMQRQEIVVILFLADFDSHYNAEILKAVSKKYRNLIESGFLQIVETDTDLYPSAIEEETQIQEHISNLPVKLNPKQNLDFAILFLYAFQKNMSKYYLQLEDDVCTSPNFVEDIKNFTQIRERKGLAFVPGPWTLKQFSPADFMGSLLRTENLDKFGKHLILFYDKSPLHSLFSSYSFSVVQFGKIVRRPSLFKHIGKHHSYREVTWWLDRRQDSAVKAIIQDSFLPFQVNLEEVNKPVVSITTNMRPYKGTTVKALYSLSSIFWASGVRDMQHITVVFNETQFLKRIYIATGTETRPHDILHRGIVEVSPSSPKKVTQGTDKMGPEQLCGVFERIAYFYEGTVDVGTLATAITYKVKCVRVLVTKSQTDWLVMRYFLIFT